MERGRDQMMRGREEGGRKEGERKMGGRRGGKDHHLLVRNFSCDKMEQTKSEPMDIRGKVLQLKSTL